MAITSYKAVVGYYNSAGTPNITTAVTGQLSDGWIPIGAPILTDAYGQCTQMMAKTDATPVIATSAYTVVTAANPQPPDATWNAQGEPLWIDTATYLQAYTKGGAYLQGTVPVSSGGTGATTAAAARANLGVSATTEVLLKADNLASLSDRAAAWLNVRPTGSTPLAADPVNPLDAATKQWVEGLRSVRDMWSVYTDSATRPANGVKATSGILKTQYSIGGVLEADTQLRTDCYIGGTYYTVISTYNRTKGVNKELAFDDTGILNSDRYRARFGELMGFAGAGNNKGSFAVEDQNVASTFLFNSIVSGAQSSANGYKTSTHLGNIHYNLSSFAQSTWVAAGDANGEYGARLAITPGGSDIFFTSAIPGTSTTYTLQKSAISDSRQKHDIEPTTVNKAWSNLAALQFVTFVYNNDEQKRTRRGIIAQQAETVDPLYVKTLEIYKDDGTKHEQKQLDTTPMLLDTMHVVQKLIAEIDALKAEVAFLKSGK